MDSGAEGSGGGAESTAENPASEGGLQRVFYCHQCFRRTFPNAEHIRNFTCNICGSGFVEDVTLREDSPSSQSDGEASFADLGSAIADSLRADSEENMEENSDLWAELTGNEPHAAASGGGGNGSGGRPRRRHHARSVAHIPLGQGGAGNQLADQFIQSLIANLTGGATRGGGPLGDLPPGAIAIATGNGRGGFPGLFQIAAGPGGGGGIPMMPLYGNPGDYAWGRGGFDSIVTQLLNQMDGTGPPPMSENNIKSIPTVKVTQCQVDANLQCSVCWDDFKLDEEVKRLRCDHYFHEDCIIPWLELHNTCPICRKEQEDDSGSGNTGENSGSQESESSATGGAGSISQQQASPHTSSSSSTSSATASGTRNSSDNLMEALGRYSSVFNSLLGIPSETPQQSRTQTAPPTQTHSGATSTSAPTATMTPSSRSTSSTSTASVSDQNPSSSSTAPPGGSSSQNQFHDMDLE